MTQVKSFPQGFPVSAVWLQSPHSSSPSPPLSSIQGVGTCPSNVQEPYDKSQPNQEFQAVLLFLLTWKGRTPRLRVIPSQSQNTQACSGPSHTTAAAGCFPNMPSVSRKLQLLPIPSKQPAQQASGLIREPPTKAYRGGPYIFTHHYPHFPQDEPTLSAVVMLR